MRPESRYAAETIENKAKSLSDEAIGEKMLSPSDFMNVFSFVVEAPPTLQFPELTFLHKDGFIE
jgi:hypothetical protein